MPAWRIILSIVVITFSLIRIYNVFNKSDNDYASPRIEIPRFSEEDLEAQRHIRDNAMYKSYEEISLYDNNLLEGYNIIKLKKDTIIKLSIDAEIKIPAGYFFQDNNDEHRRFALKSPDNITIFLHDFYTKDSLEKCLRRAKKGQVLSHVVKKSTIKELDDFSYQINYQQDTFNGYAMGSKESGYVLLFQFESTKYSSDELLLKCADFVTEHLKAK